MIRPNSELWSDYKSHNSLIDEDDDDDLSDSQNKPCTPRIEGQYKRFRSPEVTPEKIRELKDNIRKIPLDLDPRPSDAKKLNIGIAALEELSNSPRHGTRETQVGRVKRAIRDLLPDCNDPDGAAFDADERALAAAHRTSPWAGTVYAKLQKISCAAQVAGAEEPCLVHEIHQFASAEETLESHFCPPSHPLRAQFEAVDVNPDTGIWTGCLFGRYSSFFPERIQSKRQLEMCVSASQLVCSQGGRQLRRMPAHQGWDSIYFETYTTVPGLPRRPECPVRYISWNVHVQFAITQHVALSSEGVLDAVQAQVTAWHLNDGGIENPIKFIHPYAATIEIAPQLSTRREVPSGVYCTIPTLQLFGIDFVDECLADLGLKLDAEDGKILR